MSLSCFRTVVDIPSISWQLDGRGGEEGTLKEQNSKRILRWQLDGHGGEEGTLVVEAFPKLCLVAGQDMVEVDFHIS